MSDRAGAGGPSSDLHLPTSNTSPDAEPFISRAGDVTSWQRPNCDANSCDRLADLAYIGEGGDLYLCDFHGGAGEVEGWKRITDA